MPLLPLDKKGSKRHWSLESQKALEKLRGKFANKIHLVQPDKTLQYTNNSDASGRTIEGILKQTEVRHT